VLPIQPHLRSGNVASAALAFAWDEWEIKKYYWSVDKALIQRLDALTNDANLGLTNAIGEWICQRFTPFSQDPAALQFLEAAWAAAIHPAYCIYTETIDDQWRGPVRGPLAMTMTIANDAIFCLRDDPHVATRACWMYNLARHVIPAVDELERWFEQCVIRLERYHSNGSEARRPSGGLFEDRPGFGRPVPREAFDPQRSYEPVEIPFLLDAFLRTLSPATNPYLRTPAELDAVDDLPGPAYRYLVN
jgi:hypothetical protein